MSEINAAVLRGRISAAEGLSGFGVMRGPAGTPGTPGAAATVTVGTVTTGAPGTEASVTNSGTESAAVLDFVIPRGATGASGAGTGDMRAETYDPAGGAKQVAFAGDLENHEANESIHVTTAEKTEWSGKQDALTGTAGQVVGFNSDGKPEAMEAPSGGSSAAQYSATLAASGWTESGGYQTQTVTVSGLSASYEVNPDVDCQLSGTDADGDAEILNAWALVSLCETGDGTLTAKCIGDAPAANIPITVRVFE